MGNTSRQNWRYIYDLKVKMWILIRRIMETELQNVYSSCRIKTKLFTSSLYRTVWHVSGKISAILPELRCLNAADLHKYDPPAVNESYNKTLGEENKQKETISLTGTRQYRVLSRDDVFKMIFGFRKNQHCARTPFGVSRFLCSLFLFTQAQIRTRIWTLKVGL